MCTRFDNKEVEKISDRVASAVLEKMKEHQNTALMSVDELASYLNVQVDELASYLNVPKSWVYEQTRRRGNGCMPRIYVGKYLRFNIHAVLEWLKKQ